MYTYSTYGNTLQCRIVLILINYIQLNIQNALTVHHEV